MADNVDPLEIEKFSQLAHKWWDPDSEFKPLHQINPLRLNFIERHLPLAGQRVLDVGCGGGILTEGMVDRGANATGIDLAKKSLQVAQLHALERKLRIDYHCIPVEDYAAQHAGHFDGVVCMEMLEHVPDPASIVSACAQLLKPGAWAFFSTLNRNPGSYLKAVIGAEYLLGLLPRGTHDYARFLKPSELRRMLHNAGLEWVDLCGMGYQPLTQRYLLTDNTSVNYLVACRKPESS